MNYHEYYEVLELNTDANLDDIKKAYRRLAQKHHPDKGGSAERFEKIRQAYLALSVPSPIREGSRKNSSTRGFDKKRSSRSPATQQDAWNAPKQETREEELKRIFHDPNYMQHHYFTPRYRRSEETERAKRAKQKRCPICHGRGFVRYNVRPELGSIGIEERLCSCQIIKM